MMGVKVGFQVRGGRGGPKIAESCRWMNGQHHAGWGMVTSVAAGKAKNLGGSALFPRLPQHRRSAPWRSFRGLGFGPIALVRFMRSNSMEIVDDPVGLGLRRDRHIWRNL